MKHHYFKAKSAKENNPLAPKKRYPKNHAFALGYAKIGNRYLKNKF